MGFVGNDTCNATDTLGLYWGESVVNTISEGVKTTAGVALDLYDTVVTVPAQYYVGILAGAVTTGDAFRIGEDFWLGFNTDTLGLPGESMEKTQDYLYVAEDYYNSFSWMNNSLDLDMERCLEQCAFVCGANAYEIGILMENLNYSAQYYETVLKYNFSRNIIIDDATASAERILGKDPKVITNGSGDKVFLSEDKTKRIRFNIKNPHGDPKGAHGHIEIKKPNGKWVDGTVKHRIYPKKD